MWTDVGTHEKVRKDRQEFMHKKRGRAHKGKRAQCDIETSYSGVKEAY